ncbi:ORF42-like protein [Bufonid herpesvirus 1]|uniref:ORF42-like protein n=1 Tax=Bufonid herpesvirus 1 TaxID=2282206 RepID=UPI000EB76A09|nr:ORF42-like protein [Bufonid herpesvirus 1]AXF48547.1 ORF42-like protein [Bufonid herpesvirus 1]
MDRPFDPFYSTVLGHHNSIKQLTEKANAGIKLDKLAADPIHRAKTMLRMGKTEYNLMVDAARCNSGRITSSSDWAFERIEILTKAVFSVLKDCGSFRLELFQLELLRAYVIGIASKQLGSQLYKYKHKLLALMLVEDPEILGYNPETPNPEVKLKIDRYFSIYDKRLTAAIIPRRCGKSTMLEIIIASAIIFLEIDILVQAHRNNTCMTIYTNVVKRMADMQKASWFDQRFKITCVEGDVENRKFYSDKSVKERPAVCHFVPSGPSVSKFSLWLYVCVIACCECVWLSGQTTYCFEKFVFIRVARIVCPMALASGIGTALPTCL